MAMLLRRALSTRNLSILRSTVRSCDLTYTTHSSDLHSETPLFVARSSNRLGLHFNVEIRRGFAKGRSSKESDGDTIEAVDIGQIKAAASAQMDAAIVALSRDLSKLRTGRASPGMLDHIIVESGGVKMSISRIAVVSVLDPQTLSITPYDPNAIKELENAIVSSPLSINPQVDGNRLIAPIPPLTKEHIQAMCKVVAKCSEDVKQSIRRARQKALDTVKKEKKGISKDDAKRMEKEVDDLTKKFVKSAEDMCKAKEKEISSG